MGSKVMKSSRFILIFFSLTQFFVMSELRAASLNISPVLIEVREPQRTTNVTLRNTGATKIVGQVRIFAWRQKNGDDVLEPTNAVIGSPPIASIHPNSDYILRIVRDIRTPISGEEAYRLVIDELPDAAARRNGLLTVTLRYVVPVFFSDQSVQQGRLKWSILHSDGKDYLFARNEGDRRVQLRDLKLGEKVIASGLAGYVLGHSTRRWLLSKDQATAAQRVTAVTDIGPITGLVSVQ